MIYWEIENHDKGDVSTINDDKDYWQHQLTTLSKLKALQPTEEQ